jgi:uracil phosphoribosyltransferase
MLVDRTHCPVMSLLVDQTRRAQNQGPALANLHRQVGAQLATHVASRAELEPVGIVHPMGESTGVALDPERAPVIVVLMRGGLFVAEGIWECIPGAALVCIREAEELADVRWPHRRPAVLVDSVLDSGRSMEACLAALLPNKPEWVTVATLVANDEGLSRCVQRWPGVDFVTARVSTRSYVGRGSTDTGARLFGTTRWDASLGD